MGAILNLALHFGFSDGFGHAGKAKPINHHGHLAIGKGQARFDRVKLSGLGVDGLLIIEDMAVKNSNAVTAWGMLRVSWPCSSNNSPPRVHS